MESRKWFFLVAIALTGCGDGFSTFGPTGGAGGSSTSSSSTSSGGSGLTGGGSSSTSSGGTGAAGGGGGSGGTGGCEADQKLCGNCVNLDDASHGCASESCEPCLVPHAIAACSPEGACVVGSCSPGYADCDQDELSCESELNTDDVNCGECHNDCTALVTDGECKEGKCAGPCGEIVQTGWSICYELEHSAYPNDYVGLAGGVVPVGSTIGTIWSDPWYGCVSTDSSKDYVTCAQGDLESGAFMQFRAGIHDEPNYGTIAGTFACDASDCQGRCFVYQDGVEVGKLEGGLLSGLVTGIIHYQPPLFYDLKVVVP